MNVLLNQIFTPLEQFSSDYNRTCCSIKAMLLLCLSDFNNHLSSRMFDVHLLEYSCAVVGDYNITHCIYQHLVHALWSKGASNRIRNCFCGSNIVALSRLTTRSSRTFFEYENWLLTVVHRKSRSRIQQSADPSGGHKASHMQARAAI